MWPACFLLMDDGATNFDLHERIVAVAYILWAELYIYRSCNSHHEVQRTWTEGFDIEIGMAHLLKTR